MGKDIELDDIELDTEKELELSDIIKIAKRKGDLDRAKKYLQYAIDNSPREVKGTRMVLSAIYTKKKIILRS